MRKKSELCLFCPSREPSLPFPSVKLISLRIAIFSPANEHSHAAPHDIEPRSLFLHKPGTFSCERTPSVWGRRRRRRSRTILHERSSSTSCCCWRSASWRTFFLWQFPFLIKVKGWWSSTNGSSSNSTCGYWSHGLEMKGMN